MTIHLKNQLKKHLPDRLRVVLKPLFGIFYGALRTVDKIWDKIANRIVYDKQTAAEITEYFRLDRKQAGLMLKSGVTANALLWQALSPDTEEATRNFYKTTPFYVFDLAYWHMEKRQQKFRDKVVSAASGEVLEYGGGIGDLCIQLAEKGLDVTYGDLAGVTFDFAGWRFKKRGLDIKVMDLENAKLRGPYDTIICIDVIEHLSQPEVVLEEIAASLKPQGKLIITLWFDLDDAATHPMHFKLHSDVEQLMQSLGLQKTDNRWLWVKAAEDGVSAGTPLNKIPSTRG
ncbi:MAG: class I SAM-dependent methyltransferase [Dehalococcoidales bacterium]|jgi:SAM-dependent methyltransferase